MFVVSGDKIKRVFTKFRQIPTSNLKLIGKKKGGALWMYAHRIFSEHIKVIVQALMPKNSIYLGFSN